MTWFEPVFITLVGVLLVTRPKIFTRAQGDHFAEVKPKLVKTGLMTIYVGLGLSLVKLVQSL